MAGSATSMDGNDHADSNSAPLALGKSAADDSAAPPSTYQRKLFIFGGLLVLAVGLWLINRSPLLQASTVIIDDRSVGVDQLLGNDGRAKHLARLAALNVGGKTFSWKEYSQWGNELFHLGKVAKSPDTGAESKPLSQFYQCTHCHNNVREDQTLNLQDPELRFAMLLEAGAATVKSPATNATNALSAPLWLAPGSTMWGIVNRESFYNDSYEAYHDLTVLGRVMDPKSLEDATQICGKYCSVGRFMEPWELAALLTYFWDLEVTVADLELPTTIEGMLLATLQHPDRAAAAEVKKMRDLLRRLYLRKAGDRATQPPTEAGTDLVGPYPDKLSFQGDKGVGAKLYQTACVMCHGKGKPNELEGAELIDDPKRFHQVIAFGTAQEDQAYMPRFTAERLTRQQIADIQAYLLSLRVKK